MVRRAARVERTEVREGFWWGSLEESDRLEELDYSGR